MKLETLNKLMSVGFKISDGHKTGNRTCIECVYQKDNGYTKIQIYDVENNNNKNINPNNDLYEVYVKKEIGKEFKDRDYYYKLILTYIEEKNLVDFVMDKVPSNYFTSSNVSTAKSTAINGNRVDW